MSLLLELDRELHALEGSVVDCNPPSADEIVARLLELARAPRWPEAEASSPLDISVAFLLRLASINHLYDSTYRQQAVQVIRDRLSQTAASVLRRYLADSRAQAIDVCNALAHIAPDADHDLSVALDAYRGIDQVSTFRQRLLQALNTEIARVAVQPLLHLGGDPTEVLRDCLGTVVTYAATLPDQAPAAFALAYTSLEHLRVTMADYPTLAVQPLFQVLVRLQTDLDEHFHFGPYSQPAEITIDAIIRKQPLHVPGLPLAIPLSVRNEGSGVALDVTITLGAAIGITSSEVPIHLAELLPGSRLVELEVLTDPDPDATDVAQADVEVTWLDVDGTSQERVTQISIPAQAPGVKWDAALACNPYSLEAVTSADQLLGRSQILNSIVATLAGRPTGSLYIHGQKRVGKTSLARVALLTMEEKYGALTIYRDIGSVNNPDPAKAVSNLTVRLAADITKRANLPHLAAFEPDGSLAPFIAFVEDVASATTAPLIIALDEFDRLPAALFRRTAEQDAFFTGLRSLSTIDNIGVVLVAGERMKLIINGPGVELNKFHAFPVDYIDRESHWADYVQLVQRPANGILEYTSAACESLYSYTEGNPYYTKLVSGRLLATAAERRDSYIDIREVEAAVDTLLREIDTTSFSHYWEDFLLEQDDKRDEVTLNRRRCILALGAALSLSSPAEQEPIMKAASPLGLDASATASELQEFISRGLLVSHDGRYAPRVKLFERWLTERGQDQIVLTAAELKSAAAAGAERERFRVKVSEADALVKKWGTYNGMRVTGDRVLEYLHQFGGAREQRLIFQLLQRAVFIGAADEQRLLQEAHAFLSEDLKRRYGTWKQNQVAISYAGHVGKSGLAMARSYAQANHIPRDGRGIREPKDLAMAREDGVTDIVILDDFVGTGASLCEDLRWLAKYVAEDQRLHLFVLAGLKNGLRVVDREVRNLWDDRGSLHGLMELAGRSPFDVDEGVFESAIDATDARALVVEYGMRLEPRAPLGFGGTESLIVFSRTTPNDCLPILWSRAEGRWTFEPLFPRH